MRKLMFLLAAMVALFPAIAQPVIGTADLPQGGTTYLRAGALPPLDQQDFEAGGADLTWDFSGLVATADQETEYFPMSAASLTTQFVFSSADHFTAFELPEFGDEFSLPISGATVYNEFGNNAYKTIGLGITTEIFDLPVMYEDDEELLPLPFEYGATVDGTSAFEIDLEGILFYSTEQTSDIEVDAWGTLILPGGTYDCLRVKRTYEAFDSVNVAAAEIGFSLPREGTVYEWYAPGEGMPVLSIQTFIDIPAVWQFKPGETDGIAAVNLRADWSLSPCPVAAGLPIRIDGAAGRTLSVTTLEGRLLHEGPISQAPANVLDTKGWPQGVVIIRDVDSGQTARMVIR